MNDIERILAHIEMETEGEISPIQRDPQPVDFIAEVERLTTLELISIMRNVREASKGLDEISRERFAKRFEALALEADAACAYLRRFRASDEIPGWLRESGQL